MYTTVLIVKTKDGTDDLGFSAIDASKGTGTGEVALGVRQGSVDTLNSVYTPGVSSSSGPEPTQPVATPTPTSSMTITPTPTSSYTPTMTITITDTGTNTIDKEDPPGEPSGYDYYAQLVHVTDSAPNPFAPGSTIPRSYHVLQIKPKQSASYVSIDVKFAKDVKVAPSDFGFADMLSDDLGNFQSKGISVYNSSTYFFTCGYAEVTDLPADVYTTVLIVKTKDGTDDLGFSAIDASKGTGTGEVALGVRQGSVDTLNSVYTPGVSASSRMMVSKLLHSVGTGLDWNNSGDTDQSGSIGVLDVVSLLRYYADDPTFTSSQRELVAKYGDVTEDGTINTLDAVRILSFYAGLEGFDLPQRPVSSGPQSSLRPTFDVIDVLDPGLDGWTQFNIAIDTSTLNPYEFHTNNDDSGEWPASVTRKGDKDKVISDLVLSKVDKRYERIRSIEIVLKDHAYINSSVNDDSIREISSSSNINLLSPDHDKMYVYCSRTSIDDAKETRVMVVNAHNHLNNSALSGDPKIKLSQSLYINSIKTKDQIMNLIDWNKSYIGTTSIYKAEYDAGTESEPSYELTRYPDNVNGTQYTRGNTIQNFFWKLKDNTPEAEGFNRGLFLRYSLDDGQNIITGGVSNESLTSHGGTSRLIIDDMFILGNIDGNVEE